jgi:hypothetical protein
MEDQLRQKLFKKQTPEKIITSWNIKTNYIYKAIAHTVKQI